MGGLAEIFVYILELYLDIKFWFKKKKRRKYEKEHNLPKRLMIYPSDKTTIVVLVVGLCSVAIFGVFIYPSINENRTKEKLLEITTILEREKKDIGDYPVVLKDIIRNNPLRKNITKDSWNNEFWYELSKDGNSYLLFSLGKDKTPKTSDDIVLTNKTKFK